MTGVQTCALPIFACRAQEIRPFGDVCEQRRARGEERAFLRQKIDVERVDLARGAAIADKGTQRAQAIKRHRKCILANAVINHMAFFAFGDFGYAFGKIFAAVVDHMIGAEGLRLRRLLVAADGRNHGRADRFGELDSGCADTAAAGLDKDRLPGL